MDMIASIIGYLILSFLVFAYFSAALKNINPLRGKRAIEMACDVVLFVLIGIPTIILMITGMFCHGWNEGSMAGVCTISAFTPLYNFMWGLLLIIAFAGGIFIVPIIIIAFVTSIILKILRSNQDIFR